MSKSFADIFKSQATGKKHQIGSLINCKIIGRVKISVKDYFVVDAKLKMEGLLAAQEVEEQNLKIGDTVKLVVMGENTNGIIMSYKKAQRDILDKKIQDLFEQRIAIETTIVAEKDNIYKVLIFNNVPALMVKEDDGQKILKVGDNIKTYIKKIFPGGNIYVSVDAPNKTKSHFSFKVGDIVDCIVKGMNDFFVFVEMPKNDVEGVIHFNDLSWRKVTYPVDLVQEGEKLKAKVIKIEANFVILGVKQAMIDNWSNLVKKYEVNQSYEGIISEIKDSGIVVELEDGLDGFVYLFDVFWNIRGRIDLSEKFQIGDQVKAMITAIDHKRRRIQLSLKALIPNPFADFINNYTVGKIIEGTVLNDASTYGTFVFIEIVPGIDGLLHCSEMNWNSDESQTEFNFLKEKQKIKVIISDINQESGKVAVSVKKMFKDNFTDKSKNLIVGNVYDCEVIKGSYDGLFVKLVDSNLNAFIRKNEVSKDRSFRSQSLIGSMIQAKLTSINHSKRDILLSRKAFISEQDKSSIQEHSSGKSSSSINLFDLYNDNFNEKK